MKVKQGRGKEVRPLKVKQGKGKEVRLVKVKQHGCHRPGLSKFPDISLIFP